MLYNNVADIATQSGNLGAVILEFCEKSIAESDLLRLRDRQQVRQVTFMQYNNNELFVALK